MTKTTDRELLELAAKAAGYQLLELADGVSFDHINTSGFDKRNWNPLADDGDAFRLAVRLAIRIAPIENKKECVELHASDPYAATRLAVVLAAVDIGRGNHD